MLKAKAFKLKFCVLSLKLELFYLNKILYIYSAPDTEIAKHTMT